MQFEVKNNELKIYKLNANAKDKIYKTVEDLEPGTKSSVITVINNNQFVFKESKNQFGYLFSSKNVGDDHKFLYNAFDGSLSKSPYGSLKLGSGEIKYIKLFSWPEEH